MATVTALTAQRMLEIEAESVVNGTVDSYGDLILTRHDGTTIEAGHVRGKDGADATPLLQITDTPTIDLTLTGGGVVGNPWILKADQKIIAPLTKLTITTKDAASGGWYVRGADGNTYGPYKTQRGCWPVPGDQAVLVSDGNGSFVIQAGQNDWRPLNITLGTIRNYDAVNAVDEWSLPEFTVRNGFTALHGLVAFSSAVAGITVIGTLPPEARPDTDIIVRVNNSDVIRSFYIYANGNIATGPTAGANGFYSLDGIVFPAAGKATWTYVGDPGSGLAFANGWSSLGGNFGKVGFWRDEYDFVWTCGIITGGSLAANAVMIAITNPLFIPWLGQQDPVTVSADVIGSTNVFYDGTTAAIRAGVGSAAWVSLCGMSYLTVAAQSHPDWAVHPTQRGMGGSWVNYTGTTFPTFAYRQRLDGLVFTRGLVMNGTFGPIIDFLPDSAKSDRSLLISTMSNGTYGRLDVLGRQQTRQQGGWGGLVLASGSATWFSFDGLHWVP